MAGKRGQRIQTRRNSRNQYKWSKRVNAQNFVLNRKDACDFLCNNKVKKKYSPCVKFYIIKTGDGALYFEKW